MANLHAVANIAGSPIAVPSVTETVIATMTPFLETTSGVPSPPSLSTVGGAPQGILLGGSFNLTITGTVTSVLIRIRQQNLTGAIVGLSGQSVTVTAAGTYGFDIQELDPTFNQLPAIYVVTLSIVGGATGSVNRIIFTAEEATSFE